jgi:hypothetical protein
MTRESDLIGFLEEYLDDVEGHTYLPDTTRDAIRARLPSTTQRPAWWPGWRLPEMNTMMKYGLGAAAAVLVAVIAGVAALGGLGNVGAPSSTLVPSSPQPTATLLPKLSAGVREAGTYRASSFIPIEVLVTVPEGWSGGGDWLLFGPKGPEGPDGMNIRFGSVSNVFANPFDSGDGFVDPPVGPSVDDLVEAMTSHPDWTVSAPTTTTLDGYAGKVVRMTLPPDDMPTGRFMLFQDGALGDRWAFEPGQIIDFYIIDVDGERLVLELFSYPDTPAADLDQRAEILESMQLSP